MSVINVEFDLANTEAAIIPMDRWGFPAYTVQLDSGTLDMRFSLLEVGSWIQALRFWWKAPRAASTAAKLLCGTP